MKNSGAICAMSPLASAASTPGGARPVPAIPACGAGEHQTIDQRGVVDREPLGDAPANRVAVDMGEVDARVGQRGRRIMDEATGGEPVVSAAGAAAHPAVVEAHDPVVLCEMRDDRHPAAVAARLARDEEQRRPLPRAGPVQLGAIRSVRAALRRPHALRVSPISVRPIGSASQTPKAAG